MAATLAQGMSVARKIGAKQYIECSSKSGEGVLEVFQAATRAALLTPPPRVRKHRHCIIL